MVSLKEANQRVSEIKRGLEFHKQNSDILLLKGLKSGSAQIKVQINEPGYEEIQSTSVQLSVTEPIIILPTETVYILPVTKFNFELKKLYI